MSNTFNSFEAHIKNNQNRRPYELIGLRFRGRAGYNDMNRTPFRSDFSDHDTVKRLVGFAESGINSGTEFSSVVNSLLKPSMGSSATKSIISNGWGEARAMFLLTIRRAESESAGSYLSHLFVGFTDHFDVSLQSNRLPDDMRLTLNHVFTFRETPTQSVFGNTTNQSVLISSHQIFSKSYAETNTFRNPGKVIGMRPSDVFGTIQSSGLMNGIAPSSVSGSISIDPRTTLSSAASDNISFSDRCTNNNASTYMDKTIRSINAGVSKMMDAGAEWPDDDSAAMESYNYAHEADSSIGHSTPAMRFLNDLCGSMDYGRQGYVTFKNLRDFFGERVDQILNVAGNVSIIPSKQMNSTRELVRSMQGWGAKTKQTEIALILGHSIPTYMMKCGIVEYGFVSSNDSRGSFAGTSGFDTKPIVSDVGFGSVMLKLFCNSFDTGRQMTLFHDMVERELLKSISHQNAQKLSVRVTCSLCGDTVIDVSWGNEPSEQFIIPTFCDQLFGPMSTVHVDDLNDLSTDIFTLSSMMNGNSDALYSSHADQSGFGNFNYLKGVDRTLPLKLDTTPFSSAVREFGNSFSNTGNTNASYEF